MLKVCVVTSNRADFSKLGPLMKAVKEHKNMELQTVVTGSHLLDDHGHTVNCIRKEGFEINFQLNTVVKGDELSAMVESVGCALLKLPDVFRTLMPDVVVVHGDRFDAIAVATAASIMNIFLIHIEAGEVSGSIDNSLRHSITKLANMSFVCTEEAKSRVIAMGELGSNVHLTGCPSVDVLITIPDDNHVCKKYNLAPYDFVLVCQHAVTTDLKKSLLDYECSIEALLEFGARVVLIYPNIDAGSKSMCRLLRLDHVEDNPNFLKLKHVEVREFASLMKYCGCMLGNSSAGIREAGVYGSPVINIGTRQNGRTAGSNVVHVLDVTKENILNELKSQYGKRYDPYSIYGDGKAVPRMIELLENINAKETSKSFLV